MFKSLVITLIAIAAFIGKPIIGASDIKILEGEKWIGTLTYLDYTSNKKTSILANLRVVANSADKNSWIFYNEYPEEPNANGSETITLSSDGSMFGDEKVVERNKLLGGTIKIITVKEKDKKKYRYTYLISPEIFSIRKEEKGEHDSAYFERNTYSFSRQIK